MANKIFKGLFLIATQSLLHRSVRKPGSSGALLLGGLGCCVGTAGRSREHHQTRDEDKDKVKLAHLWPFPPLCFRVRIAPVLPLRGAGKTPYSRNTPSNTPRKDRSLQALANERPTSPRELNASCR